MISWVTEDRRKRPKHHKKAQTSTFLMQFISSLCVDFPRAASQNSEGGQNRRFASGAKKPIESKSGVYLKHHKKSANVSIKTAVADYERGNVKKSYDINFNILMTIKT